MSRLPERSSLPTQAADVVREMIDHGEIQDQLPGERALSSRLQVGRDTLRAALAILEQDGWISPREHGKRRQILHEVDRAKKQSKSHRVAFLSPKRLEELPPWMLIEFDMTKSLLAKHGYELELVSPGLFHLQNPGKKLETLHADTDADAWILHQCPHQVQAWFQNQQIPVLLRGYPHEGITLPAIDEDWHAAAFHAGGILKRNGHMNVGLLRPNTALAGLSAAENGLTQAINSGPTPGTVRRLVDRREPNSIVNTMEKAFSVKVPPTAIVVTRSHHILTVLTWLASRRLRVPEDLSLIALCHEPWFESIIPSITRYHLNPEATARTASRRIQRILAGRPSATPVALLIPDCIEGKSVRAIS